MPQPASKCGVSACWSALPILDKKSAEIPQGPLTLSAPVCSGWGGLPRKGRAEASTAAGMTELVNSGGMGLFGGFWLRLKDSVFNNPGNKAPGARKLGEQQSASRQLCPPLLTCTELRHVESPGEFSWALGLMHFIVRPWDSCYGLLPVLCCCSCPTPTPPLLSPISCGLIFYSPPLLDMSQLCVCVLCPHTYVNVCGEVRGQLQVPFTFCFEQDLSLIWNLASRLGCLACQSQELPVSFSIAGILSTHH